MFPDPVTRGGAERFPETRQSAVADLRGPDAEARRRAADTIVAVYWRPVYTYLRLKWRVGREDAEDLTQGFFLQALEKELLAGYDPSRARFRTYLRLCLDGYVANVRKASARLKRGGGWRHVPLDFAGLEAELHGQARGGEAVPDPAALFDREWARSLFALAVSDLQAACAASGREIVYALFARYDLEGTGADERVTYDDLAREFGTSVTQVTNHLAAARRELRRHVLARLREATGSDEEFRAETAALLGREP